MPLDHVATLLRYAGISFIAGSVNHGMFTQERSQLTAAVGILLFLVGSTLEMRQRHPGERRWTAQLGFGVLASIGLGFFTGGLQHFPDSPARSSWVVPLGFFVSVLALAFSAPGAWTRAERGAASPLSRGRRGRRRRSLPCDGPRPAADDLVREPPRAALRALRWCVPS